MKKWNTPEIAELDINMTQAGDFFNYPEFCGVGPITGFLGYLGEPNNDQPGRGGDEHTSGTGDVVNLTSGITTEPVL